MNNDELQSLQDVAVVASAKHGGARGRALGRALKEHNLAVSYTTIDKILAGTYKSRPGHDLLNALSILSGVSSRRVFEIAGEPIPLKPLADDLPPDADLLNAQQRRVVIDAVRLFAQQNRELEVFRADRKAGTGDVASAPKKRTSGRRSTTARNATELKSKDQGESLKPHREDPR